MTERLHFHFSLSCIGEGNGNPLQCSCQNPRDRGAWWAAVYGVVQSRTRLKRLSSSSSSSKVYTFDLPSPTGLSHSRLLSSCLSHPRAGYQTTRNSPDVSLLACPASPFFSGRNHSKAPSHTPTYLCLSTAGGAIPK